MNSEKLNAKVFLLAGGLGTRLKPFTLETPKPMMPINGKPILEHVIMQLKSQGLTDIVIGIGYFGDKIEKYFKDGSSLGVDIKYSMEQIALGTAGALKLARENFDEDFFFVNGDTLFDFDISGIYTEHKTYKPIGTMGLISVEDTSRYGVAFLDGKRITKFVEKPKEDIGSHLINAGVMMLSPRVFDYIPAGHHSLEKEIFPVLIKDGSLNAVVCKGRLLQCDTLELYEFAQKNWL